MWIKYIILTHSKLHHYVISNDIFITFTKQFIEVVSDNKNLRAIELRHSLLLSFFGGFFINIKY